MGERHRHAAERDGDRIGFPAGFGAEAVVDRETRDGVTLAEAGDRFGSLKAFRRATGDQHIGALVDEREMDVGAALEPELPEQAAQR